MGKRQEKIYNLLLKSNNIQLLSRNGSKLICKCGICGLQFEIIGYMNRYKIVCPYCKKTKEAERKKEKRHKKTLSDFTTIKRRCENLSYCFSTKDFLCEECHIKSAPYYSKKEFIEIINKANRTITVTGEFIDSNTPIEYRCNICGSTYQGKPHALLERKCGCKKCNQSFGERVISMYLYKNNIEYEIGKTFDDCRHKKKLRFDFYLPKFNAVIEYDGKQHYEPVVFSKSQCSISEHEIIKYRDNIKNTYCKDNHIPLLRIKYTDADIENTINEFLKTLI